MQRKDIKVKHRSEEEWYGMDAERGWSDTFSAKPFRLFWFSDQLNALPIQK